MYVEKIVQNPTWIKQLSLQESSVNLRPFQELKPVGGRDEVQDGTEYERLGEMVRSLPFTMELNAFSGPASE